MRIQLEQSRVGGAPRKVPYVQKEVASIRIIEERRIELNENRESLWSAAAEERHAAGPEDDCIIMADIFSENWTERIGRFGRCGKVNLEARDALTVAALTSTIVPEPNCAYIASTAADGGKLRGVEHLLVAHAA